jgi:hypothetical protein
MKIFRVLRKNDGAAAVEFAIVLPLFIVLTFGIIEFGIVLYNKALITNASREGARFGILYTDPPKEEATLETEVETRVQNKLGVDPDNPSDSRLISLGGSAVPVISSALIIDDPDDYLEVTVTYPYDFLLVPSFVPGLPDIMNIATTTIMRMELQEP